MDIETMRGTIIQLGKDMKDIKAAIADLEARVTKIENELSDPGDPNANQPPVNG